MTLLYSLIDMLNEMSPYLLLGFLVAGVLYAFVPASFYGRHLSGGDWRSVLKAALIGVPLPLCSCGVLPTAVSLRRNGASRASTTSFLIATPQTGVDSIAATYSLLGPAMAILRPVAALITAVAGGIIVGRDTCKTDDACEAATVDAFDIPEHTTLLRRCVAALRYGFLDTVQNIARWLIIGLVIAALITVFVPDDFFTFFAGYPLLAMIAVVIIAVPMYVCSTGSIPIALSLMLKGLSPGAAFVLLMAGPAANFASMLIVDKALGRRALVCYVSTIVIGAIAMGLCIDYLMPRDWFPLPLDAASATHMHCHLQLPVFRTICSGVLLSLLVVGIFRRHAHHSHDHENTTMNTTTIHIKGMSCAHCSAMVQKNLSKLPGVESVTVDLASGTAVITGNPDPASVAEVIDDLGFTLA